VEEEGGVRVWRKRVACAWGGRGWRARVEEEGGVRVWRKRVACAWGGGGWRVVHFAVRRALHFSQFIDKETPGCSIEPNLRISALHETRLMMIFVGKQTARGSLFLSSKSITVSLYISRQEART
jgi:hypothetical protein